MQNQIINIIKQEPFVGEDGQSYIKCTKEILTPRKTYIKGVVSGKYRGDKIPSDSDISYLYEFEIYEAEVLCNSKDDFRKDIAFRFPNDFTNVLSSNTIKGIVFPKQKLPHTLPVKVKADNRNFGVNILEPQLFEFEINRKYHQTEGEEVFGTFNAFITGYVFDYERIEQIEYIPAVEEVDNIEEPNGKNPLLCVPSKVKTGKVETKGNYTREEYLCANHPDKVWGNWKYTSTSNSISNPYTGSAKYNDSFDYGGCLGQVLGILAVVIAAFFLIKLWPILLILVGYYLFILLLGILPTLFKWIFRILGVLMILGFIGLLINDFSRSRLPYQPSPVVDLPRERNVPVPVLAPIPDHIDDNDNTNNNILHDSLITRFRSWNDYGGNTYEGKYSIKLSDFRRAHYHKDGLKATQGTKQDYDAIIHNLKEYDKNNIPSLYRLFDSIGDANKLDRIKFAEMVVTFIQDIPYAIVLENGCDSRLYEDWFTKQYLQNNKGECDGYQKFGINTPVEFLTNLKGDCDTRSLLLYTIFSHYNYDVVVLSSEFYSHSIIGINLPLNGTVYAYNQKRYVMWETTTPNAKPGRIPNEIANLNNWRISLKSK
ncbi:energy-coupling factor transporter transmembrane component T [Flavobacterium agrisoli]|uniref:DUF2304 domain-containing protein n=1 Tax=Flavobacterium agrisoli TaxID=2793066 RepID=A0A934PNC5_9FLAO|nr:energy-coupling factor transporter transmembrane component T [Flavobacterium agrisoli]MBK0370088.1 DUF2304 domain-containing protein [Flavobacterium agrisoli]